MLSNRIIRNQIIFYEFILSFFKYFHSIFKSNFIKFHQKKQLKGKSQLKEFHCYFCVKLNIAFYNYSQFPLFRYYFLIKFKPSLSLMNLDI